MPLFVCVYTGEAYIVPMVREYYGECVGTVDTISLVAIN